MKKLINIIIIININIRFINKMKANKNIYINGNVNIIGITGRKFNGKDTLGLYLIEKYSYNRLGFADSLKEACKCIFTFTDEQLYGNEKEIEDSYWKVTPRKIFQYIGTELFRNQLHVIMPDVKENIWVEVVKKQILDKIKQNSNTKIVITDVRFQNEVDMIHELGGIIIKVNRKSVNNNIDTHSSELEIDKLNIDIVLDNDNTIEDLYKAFDNIFNT
jgi:hypothetical protein